MKLKELFETTIAVKNVEKAPSNFKQSISKMVDRNYELEYYNNDKTYSLSDVMIEFGRNPTLPTRNNTIFVGNKFHNKVSQFKQLKNKVNTIKTYTDSIKVQSDRFIAKKKAGFKQQGQMINQLPDNPEDYIFQNLVEILEEFRVITYYMNGNYYVSGIYKKTGSNVSMSQVPLESGVGKLASEMAIKATKELGYGFSGCDIAIVSGKNVSDLVVSESMVGAITSAATKMVGKIQNLDKLLEENYMVVLECNSLPSMANPAIFYDVIKDIKKNAV